MRLGYLVLLSVLVAVVSTALALSLVNGVVVEDAWARAGVRNMAVYMRVRNLSPWGDCLVGVEVLEPAGLKAMLHRTIVDPERGVVRMVGVREVCMGPFGSLELEPAGYHVMVMSGALGVESVRIKLIFKSGREVVVDAPVRVG